MKRTRFKKPMALLLALIMVMSLLPVSTFAVTENNSKPTVVTGQETQTGSATPSSSDGNTTAVPYTGTVSSWFADADNGDTLTYSVVSAVDSANNTVSSGNYSISNSVITYTPEAAQASTTVTMSVKANDGTDDSIGNVMITVTVGAAPSDQSTNSKPSVVSGQGTQTGTAAPASVDGYVPAVEYTGTASAWFTDSDDGDTLTYSVVSAADGTANDVSSDVSVLGSTITYTPKAAQASGTVTIVVKATDGKDDSTENVTITVTVGAVPESTFANMLAVTYTNGYTSEDTALEISTAEQLQYLATFVLSDKTHSFSGKYIVLTKDLDLSSICSASKGSWTPIGSYNSGSVRAFSGTFNGNGFALSNLYVNATSINQGLFGYTTGATIKNLAVEGYVNSTSNYSAGIVGRDNGGSSITNCHNKATVSGAQYVGGIVGRIAAGTVIENCLNSGDLTGSSTGLGGIVASSAGTVKNCINSGSVTATASVVKYIGGIVGASNKGTTLNCVNKGSVTTVSGNDSIGGIAGQLMTGAVISNCINKGTFIREDTSVNFGGIIGLSKTNTDSVSECVNLSAVVTLGTMMTTNISNVYYLTANGLGDSENSLCTGISDMADIMNDTAALFFYNSGTGLLVSAEIDGYDAASFTNINIDTSGVTQTTSLKDVAFTYSPAGITATGDFDGVTYTIGIANLTYDYSAVDISKAGSYDVKVSFGSVTATYQIAIEAPHFDVSVVVNKSENITSEASLTVWDSDGNEVEIIGGSASIPAGAYTFELSADGYLTMKGDFAFDGTATVITIDYNFDAWDGVTKTATVTNDSGAYMIYNAANLAWFAEQVNSDGTARSAVLMADIDLGGKSWTPIGMSGKAFSGTFDGNGKKITNLYVNTQSSYSGLFGCASSAVIKDLSVSGSVTGADYTAAIVGCGGDVTITDCQNETSITGGSYCGSAAGKISGSGSLIQNFINKGDITSSGSYAGGIAGYFDSGDVVENCTNFGDVSGQSYIGGIVGRAIDAQLTDCNNEGNVNCSSDDSISGGIVGEWANSSDKQLGITGCINKGSVTNKGSMGYVGGISGRFYANYNSGGGIITNSANIGDISGSAIAGGGLVGYLYSGASGELLISRSYNTGIVTADDKSAGVSGRNVGGLIGHTDLYSANYNIEINNCFNTGNVTAAGDEAVGGLLGSAKTYSYDSDCGIYFKYCYNSGSAAGLYKVGGLAGYISTGISVLTNNLGHVAFLNCYSSAPSVTASGSEGIAGTGIGEISDFKSPDYLTFSNVFVLGYGELDTVGADSAGIDANAIVSRTNDQMTDSSFVTLLGGAFANWSGDIYNSDSEGYDENIYNEYVSLYSSYAYPVLLSLCGGTESETYNVKFTGAKYAAVTVNDIETYATTVEPNGSVSFTLTNKYPDYVTIDSVSVGDETLTDDEGVYTVSNINADTTITVSTTGVPPFDDTSTYTVTFNIADSGGNAVSGATITVSNQTAEADGSYKLKAGSYSVSVSKEGYATVEGTFVVKSGTNSISTVLYNSGTDVVLTLETGVSVSVDICNGDIIIGNSDNTKTFTLPAGKYAYSSSGMGSGPLAVSSDETVILCLVNFAKMLDNSDNMNYTMTVTGADGTEYSPGSRSSSGGNARAYFILPAAEYGAEYKYAFVPSNSGYWGSSGVTYLYNSVLNNSTGIRNFQSLNLSDGGKFVIAKKTSLTITVPQSAELHVNHMVRFYEPCEELTASSVQNNGDTATYTFDAPSGTYLFYELELDGYVKKADLFSTDSVTSVSISKSDLTPLEKADEDIDNTYAANIIMNAPDSKYIELNQGELFELYCFRNWQAINTTSSNYYINPDYTVEVISGDSVEITDPYYAGAVIKAVDGKSGISIVRVTYDALDYIDSKGDYLYSKLWEQNTAVLVFNVNPTGSATIDTGITLTEYDTVYYTCSVNGLELDSSDQYAEYTFMPTVTNGTLASVSIHAPIGSTDSWDDSAWTTLTGNGDGSYTARLTDGRSVIRVTAEDGTAVYHVVKAFGIDMTIEGDNTDVGLVDGQFVITSDVNDTVEVSFSGVELPCPKLGAIYNPGYPDTTYMYYSLSDSVNSTKTESEHTQYAFGFTYPFTLTFDSIDTYTLSSGRIHCGIYGSSLGTHRSITKGGLTGTQSTYSDGALSGETDENFNIMPNITINVTGEEAVGTQYDVTITAPGDIDRLTVRNSSGLRNSAESVVGSTYLYSLVNNDSTATYTYYAERSGYITQVGAFTVTDGAVSVDLTKLNWTPVTQSGSATVSVVGYETVLANCSASVSAAPDDLVSQGYVLYNHGGYTVLHALLDALEENKADYTCKKGVLEPEITISGSVGSSAGWMCEVNGTAVSDYANTLINNGDEVVFYYNPATASAMRHAWFTEESVSATKDGSASLTLVSTPVSNDGTAASPVSGATVYIDGVSCGKTNSSGVITLSDLTNLALGAHTVTAKLNDTLTFARAALTITKSGGSDQKDSDTVTVTFRLIGDTVHDAAYNGYINWIKTGSYTLAKGSTMEDMFTAVLDSNDMDYDDTSDNYVAWICAPAVLGGYKLAEFSNGGNSGWMYTVDGYHPTLGLCEYVLTDGDEIIWHYVNDYTLETSYKDSVPKYVNPWLSAADVTPYAGMLDESKDNAEDSYMGSSLKSEETAALTLTPSVTAKDGSAAVSISSSDLEDAISYAKENGGSSVIIAPSITGTAAKVTVELPKASLASISEGTDANITIKTLLGTVTIPNNALDSIYSQASGSTVTVSLNTVETALLTEGQKTAVGGNTVYDISVLSGSSKITSFDGNNLTISLPYTLQSGEDASGVTVWYLDDSGSLQQMTATYDKTTSLATFTTTHLSYYLVGYTAAWTNPFTDVTSTAWFYDAVRYVSQNSLMSGTSSTTFAPKSNMTRAMLVTVLYRLGGKPTVTGTNSFTDVESGQWYTDAVVWASTNKLVTGYGGGMFGTTDSVTREQLAAILYNYAKYKGYDVTKTVDLMSYTDASSVDSWATDALKWSVAEGLIAGTTSTTLAPTGAATRAQVATILMRFVENISK